MERDLFAETHCGFCELFANGFFIDFIFLWFNEPLIRQRKVSDFRSQNQLLLQDLTFKYKPNAILLVTSVENTHAECILSLISSVSSSAPESPSHLLQPISFSHRCISWRIYDYSLQLCNVLQGAAVKLLHRRFFWYAVICLSGRVETVPLSSQLRASHSHWRAEL